MSNLEPYQALPPASELKHYAFYRLVELLAKRHDFDLEVLEKVPMPKAIFRFTSDTGLGFPASEISLVERNETHQHYVIQVNFLGMHGASSPLPGFILEEVAHSAFQGQGAVRQFLDFFNHRLNIYLYKIWRKYRYYAQFKPNATDGFSDKVFSFIGLNDKQFRSLTHEHTINWSKLLSFSGLIASRSRSPSIVSGIVAYYFNLSQVEVAEWQPRIVDISAQQKNSLGAQNSVLGDSFIIGSQVTTYSSKFVIKISDLSQEIFHKFLPTGEYYEQLKLLLAFLLREQMPYDLQLGVVAKEIPLLKMDDGVPLFLGWTTLMSQKQAAMSEFVTIGGVQ